MSIVVVVARMVVNHALLRVVFGLLGSCMPSEPRQEEPRLPNKA